MKNQKNKLLLLLLNLGMSMHMLTAIPHAVEGREVSKPAEYQKATPQENTGFNTKALAERLSAKVIDSPEVMKNNLIPRDLLKSHARATNMPELDLSNQNEGETLNPLQDARFVTPAALLTSILSTSQSYQEAFSRFNHPDNKNLYPDPSQQLLAQQARTLLVRAHPELIQGLSENLAYLPNRFVSYFKEKLPTLSTKAGKLRFTQSVMMETLKSMPKLPQDTIIISERSFSYQKTQLTPQQNQSVFNPQFTEQFNDISAKYSLDLDTITAENNVATQVKLIAQWSRNIIVELALLTPRAVGATVGATAGALNGMPMNYALPDIPQDPLTGAIRYGTAGAQAGEYVARSAANAVGQGARATGRALNQGTRYAYDQSSRLFTPRSNLTTENLKDAKQGQNKNKVESDTDSETLSRESWSDESLSDTTSVDSYNSSDDSK